MLCLSAWLGFSQVWHEWPQKIELTNAINEQDITIDPDSGEKYSFYLDGNGMAILKKYNEITDVWDQVTTSFDLIGTSSPMHLSVIVKSGEIVLGFFDGPSQNYYIFHDTGGGFNQVITPIFNAEGLSHAKLVYEGSLNNSYLLRYQTSGSVFINVTHVDVPGQTSEDYGDLPIPGTNPIEDSRPDIFVSNSDIWVIHEYYSSGAGGDECLIQKCPVGSPFSWSTHASIGVNFDDLNIYGDPNDFPYIAYEDINNTFVKLDKISATNYDNISQLAITPSGIEGLRLARNSGDEVFIAYKNLQDNKVWVMKNNGGSFLQYGSGSYANYTNINAIDLMFFDPYSSLFLGFGVPPGPSQGGYLAQTNYAPSGSATYTKQHCNNSSPADTMFVFTTTDLNSDSTYVFSVTSDAPGVVADAQMSISNSNHSFGQTSRTALISIAAVGNAGVANISVSYTDGIDTLTQNVPYTVYADPSITLTIPTMDTCVNVSSFDLNNYVTPTGGTWTGGNIFDPAAQGVGTHNIDYNLTDGNGCSAMVTQVINVNGLPNITFTVDPLDLCAAGTSENLLPYANPSGGSFIEGDNFDPGVEGVGSHVRTYQYTDGNGCTNTNTMTVEVHAQPIIIFQNVPVQACLNDGIIDLTQHVMPTGDVGVFSPNDSFDPEAFGVGTHNINYTLTNAYGCFSDDNFNVEVHALPLVDFIASDIQLCSNADIYDLNQNINGGDPGEFLNTQGNYFDPVQHAEGSINDIIYKVTELTNGCSDQDTFQISLLAVPELTSNITNSNCGANDGAIDLNIASSNGATTVYWNNGSNTEDLSGLAPGTYYANVTDAAGCISVLQSDVQSNEIDLTANITNATCFGGNDGAIDLTPAGNGPFLFLWATADSTEDVSDLTVGTYFVTVTDNNGCIATASYYVSQPDPIEFDYAVTPSNCPANDGSITISNETGGDGTYNYNWIGTTGGASVTGLANGNYTFWIDDANGCLSETANIDVSGNGAAELFANVTHSDCNQDNGEIDLIIDANPADIASISWSNTENTEDITGLAPGTYTVTVEDNSGCTSTLTRNIEINAPLQNDLCVVTVDSATTTNLVVWERVETNGIDHYNIYRENAIAGEYVKIDEVDADSLSQYVDLAASPEVRSWRYKLSATNECNVEGPQSLHHKTIHIVYSDGGSGNYDINWDQYEGFNYGTYYIDRRDAVNTNWVEIGQVTVGNALTLTDNPPVITGLDYRVTVETPGQCSATKANDYNSSRSNRSAGIFSPGDTDSIPDVGLTELVLDYEINVFPNPFNGTLNIQVEDKVSIESFEIKGVNGTTIRNEKVFGNSVSSDLSDLERGIYFVIVHTSEGKSLHKVIKQ